MSYFGEELVRQMTAKTVTGQELASRIGLSSAQVSKWTRGDQTSIDEAKISLIQAALGDDPNEHARLVLAHLLDEKFGLNHELVDVTLRIPGEMSDRPRPHSKGEAAISFLADERLRNRELNDLLIDLARVLKPVSSVNVTLRERGTKYKVSSRRKSEIAGDLGRIVKQTPPPK